MEHKILIAGVILLTLSAQGAPWSATGLSEQIFCYILQFLELLRLYGSYCHNNTTKPFCTFGKSASYNIDWISILRR